MAQIDASIYNALLQPQKSALDYAEQYAQADDRKAQRSMNALAMQEQRAAIADQAGYRSALAAAPQDEVGRIRALIGSANPLAIKHGQEMQKASVDALEKRTKITREQGQAVDEAIKRYRGSLDYIDTQQGAARWLQAQYQDPVLSEYMQRLGPLEQSLSRIPQDPAGFENWRRQAGMGMEKHIELIRQQQVADEGVRHNKAGEALTAEGHKVTMRGQNLTDARARDALKQSDRHFQATQSAGVKMTEDQGKATGWLIQAENAWKNMQAAIDPKTGGGIDAAKPGLNDALAAIPSLGLTTSIANSMRGENRQKFMQGASSLSEAMLRAATGAGVNKDEAAQKIRELTPVFGDDDATIKQKMDAIPLYIESLKVRAGPGASKASVVLNSPSVAPNTARSVVNVKPGGVIRFDAQGNMIP